MEKNKCYYGDAMELSKDIPDNSLDLVITSPPYVDIISYGKKVKTYSGSEYSDWFLPLIHNIHRSLKSSGSFILNINDKIDNGLRSVYVYDLILRITRETGLKLYDRYVWYKKSALPMTGDKRLNDRSEYIFHFIKDKKQYKPNTDAVRVPYAESSINRFKTTLSGQNQVDDEGTRIGVKKKKKSQLHPLGTKPTGVFRFDTRSAFKGGKHPAPFHPQMPEFFIKWLTKEGDVVMDPFMGGGTTAHVAEAHNREWIGLELNETYKALVDNIEVSYPKGLPDPNAKIDPDLFK